MSNNNEEQEYLLRSELVKDELNQIQEKLRLLFDELKSLAEKHRVRIYSHYSELGQSYTPNSLQDLEHKVSKTFLENYVTDGDIYITYGWERSALC